MNSSLHCPRCSKLMLPGTTAGGRVWECATCHGRFVSHYALRWMGDAGTVDALWKAALQYGHRGRLPCPLCNRPMFEQPLPAHTGAAAVDACRSCHMMWFDTGEFESLPKWKPSNLNRRDNLTQDAREILALEKARQIRERAESEFGECGPSEAWQVVAGFLGMPVEYDNPISTRPWITWGFAALCLTVFLLSLASGLRAAIDEWGFVPAEPLRHFGLTWLTSVLLHGDAFHLIGNLYFLLVFGDNVEEVLGRRRYVLLLIAAALAGAVLHALGEPRKDVPCVGASGAISGIIALYAFRFPQARLGTMLGYSFDFRWFSFSAWGGLVMWGLLQLLLAGMQTQGYSNVSALAHLGGAAMGVGLWWRIRTRGGGADS